MRNSEVAAPTLRLKRMLASVSTHASIDGKTQAQNAVDAA